jgi:DNA-directed RNA polymerase subunit alpha
MSSNLFLNNHPEVKANLVKNSDQNYTLVIEPLYPGYGYTIGNSLRRIFLSSIPGFGITKIKINDLTHEYQPVAGLVEDALQVILNLKMVRARIKTDEERVTMSFSRNTAGTITAGEFKSAHAEIINKDLHICTLNKGSKLDIEIEISRGVGYLSMDDVNLSDNKDARQILVDTVFSPVANG